MAPRLKEKYKKEVTPALTKEFGYKNPMSVPKLEKIVINMGLGEAIQNAKILDAAVARSGDDRGQKPVITKAKKSIAAFKLREGHEHRDDGHAARRPDVRVSRSLHQHYPAARARLSRRLCRSRLTGAATTRSVCAIS